MQQCATATKKEEIKYLPLDVTDDLDGPAGGDS